MFSFLTLFYAFLVFGSFWTGLRFAHQIKLLCFIDLTLIFCKEKSENGIEEFDYLYNLLFSANRRSLGGRRVLVGGLGRGFGGEGRENGGAQFMERRLWGEELGRPRERRLLTRTGQGKGLEGGGRADGGDGGVCLGEGEAFFHIRDRIFYPSQEGPIFPRLQQLFATRGKFLCWG